MLTRPAVLRLAVPVILAQAASATTGLVDTLVMGLHGDATELAAVAVASVVFGFLYWGFGFLRMSTTGLAAQAIGAGNRAEARAVALRALGLGALIGLVALAASPLLRGLAFLPFAASASVEGLAGDYFAARIWGAPANLAGLAVGGYLLGTGRTAAMLGFQVVLNGVNAGLDVWFVAGLGMGPAGIGAGTALAEWVALGVGLFLVRDAFRAPARLFDRARLAALFAANRDITIRTLALLFCFAWFVRSGTLISTPVTAANEVLLQFVTVTALVLDGFAFVTEKETGEAWGARDRARLVRAVRLTSEFAIGSALLLSCAWLFGGAWLLERFVTDVEVRDVALAYLPWAAAAPALGVAAWQLDGLFLGTVQGRALRNAGVAAAALYVACDLALRSAGNDGVWAALLAMYALRALALGAHVPGLLAGVPAAPQDAGTDVGTVAPAKHGGPERDYP